MRLYRVTMKRNGETVYIGEFVTMDLAVFAVEKYSPLLKADEAEVKRVEDPSGD